MSRIVEEWVCDFGRSWSDAGAARRRERLGPGVAVSARRRERVTKRLGAALQRQEEQEAQRGLDPVGAVPAACGPAVMPPLAQPGRVYLGREDWLRLAGLSHEQLGYLSQGFPDAMRIRPFQVLLRFAAGMSAKERPPKVRLYLGTGEGPARPLEIELLPRREEPDR